MKKTKLFSLVALVTIVVLLMSAVAVANPHTPPPGGGGGVVVPPPPPPVDPEPPVEPPPVIEGVVTLPVEVETSTDEAGKVTDSYVIGETLVETITKAVEDGAERVVLNLGDSASPPDVSVISIDPAVFAAAAGAEVVIATPKGALSFPADLVAALADSDEPVQFVVQRPATLPAILDGTAGVEGAKALQVLTDVHHPTQVTIYKTVTLPADAAARQALLDKFLVIANHSGGTTEFIHGLHFEIEGDTLKAVSFWVDHFSTFQLVQVDTSKVVTFRIDTPGFQIAGKQKEMVASYLKQGNTMMPIRMLEDFGVQLNWNQTTGTATFVFGKNTVALTIGSTDAYINGVRTPIIGANGLLMAPELAPGRTMIPSRFVSEKLGFAVEWAADGTITITPK